ncbi:eukaryotic translation initiation factor 4E1 [Drosophila subpulchrella]|uniref:eukaryotic translation initiation factor 4E1 n=1 Tax=Drosophila subpulchrella TaxID=1486046 RepID=UPI0018A1811C|nr:eukaryotic translation initiation factor 4E1 [Drosophila subpulchrella]
MLTAQQNEFKMMDCGTETLTDSRSSSSQDLKTLSEMDLRKPLKGIVDVRLKHPLENTWTLWYLENDRTKSWEDMQNEITSFDMVEDFWSLYNHIKPPSEIRVGSDYSLFKKGIQPMWEDDANKYGGRWVINMGRGSKLELDKLWLDVLLILIGEAFEHTEEVCGAVINLRGKSNKISIWTANGHNELAVMEIGLKLRDLLVLPPHQLQYQLHKDSMSKQGSVVKAVYCV